jgi:predicted acylesterase/phospholipase RssA
MTYLARCLAVALALAGGRCGLAHAAADTVTLGLPERLLREAPITPETFDRLVRAHMAQLPCWRRQGCASQPQVSVALGTDYEILDWFGKGLLDVAVVPEVGARLLRDDRLDFVDFELTLAGNTVSAGSRDAPAQLERFAEAVWCGARARAPTRWDTAHAWLAKRQGVTAPPSCERPARPATPPALELPSHFRGFTEAVDAAAGWLAPRLGPWSCDAAARTLLEDGFWTEFFARTRFTFRGEPTLRSAAGPIPLSTRYSGDRLIITKPVARRLQVRTSVGRPEVPVPPAVAELWGRACDDAAGEMVRQLPAAFRHIVGTVPAFGVRTFGFSPGESIELLRAYRARGGRVWAAADAAPDPIELALVLPGGGVKAAYQTTLLEQLYQAGLLRNRDAKRAAAARDAALDVNYVIGTSGGALLGYFAARLDGAGPWGLDRLLWQWCRDEACRDMQSTDIFGYVDMPRYISAVVILLVFAVIMAAWLPRTAPSPEAARRGRRWRLAFSIVPLLLALPFVIRYVSGGAGREHIPEIEGFVYMLCILVAMFADQSLILDEDVPDRRSHWRAAGAALAVVGLAAIIVPAVLRATGRGTRWLDHDLPLRVAIFGHQPTVHMGGLLVCAGGLLLLVGLVVRTSHRRRYHAMDARGFGRGFGVGVLHIVLASALVYAIVVLWPAAGVTLLELTPMYWLAIAGASAAVAALLLLARWAAPAAPVTGVIARGIDYLAAGHPNGAHTARRVVRLTAQAALAVGWWNLILAPAMYGNRLALQFLTATDERFLARHARAEALQVPLIVTANILEADGARYFAFLPASDGCLRLARRSGYGAVWRVFLPEAAATVTAAPESARDCHPAEKAPWDRRYLRDVIFASGSPYPVFPAHSVPDPKRVRLVDGGYANNVPLDAAQAVGADAVLIVESSNPLGHEAAPWSLGALPGALRVQGDLVGNLPRLFTFLWERSQELDKISRRELLVVSLAPSREHAEWPNLVQFTPGVINRMKQVARDDWQDSRRIGMVQSWGRPRFAYSVAGARIP